MKKRALFKPPAAAVIMLLLLVLLAVPAWGAVGPTASFTVDTDSGRPPLTVYFNGMASSPSTPEGWIDTYSWDFGDGTTEPDGTPTVSHEYPNAGEYDAVLTVTDDTGLTDSFTVTIYVVANQTPVAVAKATPTSGTAPLMVGFNGLDSYDPDGFVYSHSYSWDFGDGSSPSSSSSPWHEYSTPGDYTAVLTVWDNEGASDTDSVVITVSAPPSGPDNDDFESAATISGASGSISGTTVNATGQTGEKTPWPWQAPLTTVWYRWVAPADGRATFDLSAGDFDTVLEIYDGGPSLVALNDLGGDDDGSPSGGNRSMLRLKVVEGTTYWLQVDGKSDYTGSFTLSWSLLDPLPNDDFVDAVPLTGVTGSIKGDNIMATGEPGEPWTAAAATVWYSFTPAGNGTLAVNMTAPDPSGLDTVLYVMTGTAVDAMTFVTWDMDGGEGLLSAVSFPAASGTTYYIRVDGGGYEPQGSFTLGWQFASDGDTTAPTVTVDQASGQLDPTSAGPVDFTVVFSEPVVGLTAADVTLGGTAGATTAVVTQIAPNDGTTYNVAVSGMTVSGTVVASIAAGMVEDQAGNPNSASTSSDNTVTYTAPAAPHTYDQLDGRIVYGPGPWSVFLKPGYAYLGSYSRSSARGASATIHFTGTRLDWIGMKGVTTGIVDVYLDGVKQTTVDLTASTATYQVRLWSTGFISHGDHYVTLKLSPLSPARKFITLDAVEIWGEIRAPS